MAGESHDLPNWITAISTAVTAVAAIAAGIVAWIGIRLGNRPPLPVIEPEFNWVPPNYGHFISLDIVTRNQLYETITIESARIKRPRRMTFATEIQRQVMTESSLPGIKGKLIAKIETHFEKSKSISEDLGWVIAPLGETATAFRGTQHEWTTRTDVKHQRLYLSPPENWDGGGIAVELLISSKALTIRPRRITMKRQISAAPIIKSDAAAKSQS